MKDIQLTKEGLEKLQKEYQSLKDGKRKETVERLQKARGMGDLSENGEYSAAKEELDLIEERILEIEEVLKHAKVLDNQHDNHEISLGSYITVESNGSRESYQVVGEFEADPLKKRLSVTSPLGKAFLGKKTGSVIEVEVPAGKTTYKILEIK